MNSVLGRRLTISCTVTLLTAAGCKLRHGAAPVDDAGGRRLEDFPELGVNFTAAMDGGIGLTDGEIKGRNTWLLWCAGDEQFWDRMARESHGLIDLLQTIDSRHRPNRFRHLGLINEPGYRRAEKPDAFGLWIDEPVSPEPAGVDPAVYGRATGIIGFRLFSNPDFDAVARARWDPERFYHDPGYASQPTLVRPYRVGISCAACHVAFDPVHPPADPEQPRWENLSSAIGNQYLREGRVFAPNARRGGFFQEMLEAQPPGTSDTSRIATDHINNPSAINALFGLRARLGEAHEERLSGESLLLPGARPITAVPRVLKDGADSVGVAGALLRVYVSIGLFSQHSLQQHDVLIGLTPQKPFSISLADQNSVYWRATENKVAHVADFLARLPSPHLADAPGGRAFLTQDRDLLNRGRLVFAERCAGCHSSKQPPPGANAKAWFQEAASRDDFCQDNFFSNEQRYPVTRIGTNADRALATNAEAGHIWQNFSSDSYKALPSVGTITVYNPYTGQTQPFPAPAGGPGYYRPPSLLALWSSAPFFHNNALGTYTGDPSVAGRMAAFSDAVEELLWPEKRLGPASIWRTAHESTLDVRTDTMPRALRHLLQPATDAEGVLHLGPIPAGTPINLVANLDPDAPPADLAALCLKLRRAYGEIRDRHLEPMAADALLRAEVAPALFAVNKCTDLVADRGHTFGADLGDPDKRALIEFLKTL